MVVTLQPEDHARVYACVTVDRLRMHMHVLVYMQATADRVRMNACACVHGYREQRLIARKHCSSSTQPNPAMSLVSPAEPRLVFFNTSRQNAILVSGNWM